jgi:putative membrane protein
MVRAVALVATVVIAVLSPLFAGIAHAASGQASATDTALVTQFAQSANWEITAGKWAQNQASSPAVRTAAAAVVTDDNALAAQLAPIASQFGVSLPTQPSAEQRGWLSQLHDEAGGTFDHDYVNLVRQNDGGLFTALAAARAGTRNDLIKQFAQGAVDVVMRHMTMVESTKLVDATAPQNSQQTDPAQGADPASPTATTDPGAAGQQPVRQAAQSSTTAPAAIDDRPSPVEVLVGVLLIVVLAGATVKIIRRVVNSA